MSICQFHKRNRNHQSLLDFSGNFHPNLTGDNELMHKLKKKTMVCYLWFTNLSNCTCVLCDQDNCTDPFFIFVMYPGHHACQFYLFMKKMYYLYSIPIGKGQFLVIRPNIILKLTPTLVFKWPMTATLAPIYWLTRRHGIVWLPESEWPLTKRWQKQPRAPKCWYQTQNIQLPLFM